MKQLKLLDQKGRISFPLKLRPRFLAILLVGISGMYLANTLTSVSTKYFAGICLGLLCIGILIHFHRYLTQIMLFAFVAASGIGAQYRFLTQKDPNYSGYLHYGALPEPTVLLLDFPLFLLLGMAFWGIF